jgi:hypothetical protein
MVFAFALVTIVAQAPVEAAEPDIESDRLNRIGVTLAGGAAGIALPLLVGFAIQATEAPCPVFATCDGAVSAASLFLPATAGIGLGLSHALLKGRAGAGFGLAGALGGYGSGLMMLAIATAAGSRIVSTSPVATGGMLSLLSLVGAVVALELRHHGLENGYAKTWHPWRMVVTSLVNGIGAGLPSIGIIAFGLIGFAFGSVGIGAAILGVLGSIDVVLGSLAAWGVHRAMDGGGKFWSALVGNLISTTLATLMFVGHLGGPPAGGVSTRTWAIVPVGGLAALIFSVGPAIGLEWTNTSAAPNEESSLRLQPGFAVTPGGGLLTLGGAF